MDPLHPPIYASINTTLTPIFVPNRKVSMESYYNMVGPGISAAFLYNPLDPTLGLSSTTPTALLQYSRTAGASLSALCSGASSSAEYMGVESWWSRPQTCTTCPEDVYYDLGPAVATGNLKRFGISGHMVWRPRHPDDVLWHAADREDAKVVDAVPAPFLESQPPMPIPPDIRVMMRTIATMARMKRWWWKLRVDDLATPRLYLPYKDMDSASTEVYRMCISMTAHLHPRLCPGPKISVFIASPIKLHDIPQWGASKASIVCQEGVKGRQWGRQRGGRGRQGGRQGGVRGRQYNFEMASIQCRDSVNVTRGGNWDIGAGNGPMYY
ncbi:hypothetical protein B0H13DRAFT_2299167 [Mycena leptocephala]|nr:hypothetical protein B0H13DRAFT_2299167 [Mycena leptocephala]